MQPPDAVVGQHKPIVLDCGQRRVGFGDHCTQKPHPVPCAWNLRAEDNPDRRAMRPASPLVAQHQPTTEVRSSGLNAEAEVLEMETKVPFCNLSRQPCLVAFRLPLLLRVC